MACFRPPNPLQYDSLQTMVSAWKSWKKDFTVFMRASKNEKETDTIKISMFMNLIGHQGIELFELLDLDAESETLKLNEVMKKFDEHMDNSDNVIANRYDFWTHELQEGQSLENYIKEICSNRKGMFGCCISM